MKPLDACRLYAFVDTGYLAGRAPEEVTRQLCAGGADLIQLRAKNSTVEEVRRLTEAVLPVARNAGVGLVVNDHPAIAAEFGAELCHLGQEDFFGAGYSNVRQVAQTASGLGIGLSTHSQAQAQRAVDAAADYVAVGPVFATATKPGAIPVTLEYVSWAAVHLRLPWFAIGGITLANVDSVVQAGAKRVCVVSAILQAPDITQACRKFKQRLPP